MTQLPKCVGPNKKVKFELLEQGTFWLSPASAVPSKGWDAALPRICTWGQFRDKGTGFVFYFFNTHFDHMGGWPAAKAPS